MTAAAMQMADINVWAHRFVTGVDAPPVLEPAEHVLDFVTLGAVMFNQYFPVRF
jgi:hypothetical protein